MANNDDSTLDGPKETYYSIAGYLPESAQRMVLEYLPQLERSVDSAVRNFGRSLANDIKDRTKEELCAGHRVIAGALCAIRAEEQVTDEHKRAMKRFGRYGARLGKSLRRLDREVEHLREVESNIQALDRQLHMLEERIDCFRLQATREGIGLAAGCLRAFYDGWEPGAKDISVAIDGELERTLEELRRAVEDVGATTADVDREPEEDRQQEHVETGAEEGSSGLASRAREESDESGVDVAEQSGDASAIEIHEDVAEVKDGPQVGDAAGEEDRPYGVHSDDDALGRSQGPARAGPVRHHEAPLTTVAPTDGTPRGDTDSAYRLTKLVDALRRLSHKKLGEQTCAASIEVQRAARKCDKLLRRRGIALKDAKESVKATVLGVDRAKAAVAETARRVTRAIEDSVAAAKLESFRPR